MSDKIVTRTTCPRDCYDACGIAVVKRADGLVKVLGDPDHAVSRGALCGKCAIAYNGAWLDPGVRLTRPLKRIGPKGEGRFEAISWDRAIGEIATRLKKVVSAHGAETIWHAHYTGTCSLLAGELGGACRGGDADKGVGTAPPSFSAMQAAAIALQRVE